MAGTGVAYPVSSTELLLGLEATRGTAATTTSAVPIRSPKLKFDQAVIEDETLQGSMVEIYDQELGLRYDAHGWDSYPYLDTFPILLAAELGSPDTKTAAPASTTLASSATKGSTTISATATIAAGSYIVIGSGATLETHLTSAVSGTGPFTVTLTTPLVNAQANAATVTGLTKHQWSLLNNSPATGNMPLSCTINDFDGQQWRQFSAAQLDKLTIKGNATGFVDYTCNWFANPFVVPSTPSYSPSTTTAPPGWTATISIGGTAINYAEDWEIDLGRQIKAIPAVTGSPTYFEYQANGITSVGKLTLIEQSGAPQVAQYLAGSTEALDITLYDVQTGYALNLHSTNTKFKTGEVVRGAKGEVKTQFDLQLLPSATDALAGGKSPIVCTIANATTTAYVGS